MRIPVLKTLATGQEPPYPQHGAGLAGAGKFSVLFSLENGTPLLSEDITASQLPSIYSFPPHSAKTGAQRDEELRNLWARPGPLPAASLPTPPTPGAAAVCDSTGGSSHWV